MPATGTVKMQKNTGGAGVGRLLNIGVGALFLTRERMENLFSEWEQEGAQRFQQLENRILRRSGSTKKSANWRTGNGNGTKKKTMRLSKKDMEKAKS